MERSNNSSKENGNPESILSINPLCFCMNWIMVSLRENLFWSDFLNCDDWFDDREYVGFCASQVISMPARGMKVVEAKESPCWLINQKFGRDGRD